MRRIVGDVAWLLDGRIYYADETFGQASELHSMEADGTADRVLPAPVSCDEGEPRLALRGLSDGGMAVSARCGRGGPTQLLAYDSGATQPASRWAEPAGRAVTAVWDPAGRRGFLASDA